MDTELWVYLHEQMYMVRHDFHLYDVDAKLVANFLYEFLQSHIDTIDQDLSAVFWTPDHMIFTGVHHVMITFIFHRNIIQPIPI